MAKNRLYEVLDGNYLKKKVYTNCINHNDSTTFREVDLAVLDSLEILYYDYLAKGLLNPAEPLAILVTRTGDNVYTLMYVERVTGTSISEWKNKSTISGDYNKEWLMRELKNHSNMYNAPVIYTDYFEAVSYDNDHKIICEPSIPEATKYEGLYGISDFVAIYVYDDILKCKVTKDIILGKHEKELIFVP